MHNLMPEYAVTRRADWAQFFDKYDIDRNGTISKEEMKQMLYDSGLKRVTQAEADYIYKVLSKNARFGLNKPTFIDWGKSMEGKTQRSLI